MNKVSYIIKSRYMLFLLGVCILAGGSVALFPGKAFEVVRYIDKNYLHETLKDIRAQIKNDEDWSGLQGGVDYDYSWLGSGDDGFIKIAHALGQMPEANSFAAFEKSRAAGFRFFEVDLWLDGNGRVRCHHGPKSPPALTAEDCTLGRLLPRLWEGEYLVLDIKTGFGKTAEAVLRILDDNKGAAQRVIFQLYAPSHVRVFNGWLAGYELAGPVVTAYNSPRALNHIYKGVSEAGIMALTFPFERFPALSRKNNGIKFLTHPVKSCDELEQVEALSLDGAYMKNTALCR